MAGFDEYRSQANRQDLDFEHIEHAYMQAKAREMDDREQAVSEWGVQPFRIGGPDEIRDWRVVNRRCDTFGPMASSMTVQRGAVIVPKDKE